MNTEKFTKAFEQSVPQIYRGSKSPKFWHSFFAFVCYRRFKLQQFIENQKQTC